jgi:FixJ family two-component response regulator
MMMRENFHPTVFVVDDDDAVRKSLVRLLTSASYQTASYASADEFLRHWMKSPVPGCVLLDIYMPGLDGFELQQKLQTCAATIPIIFITGLGDIPSSVKAMKAGAVDFFSKPIDGEKLLEAVDEAIARDHQERIERREREKARRLYDKLTPRECQVMSLVICGMLNKQIADALGASEKTIKIHRGRVMQKMRAQSVPDLVRVSQKIGLKDDSCA